MSTTSRTANNITTVSSKASEDMSHNEQDCLSKYTSFIFEEGAIFCNATFDTYLCWPPTKADTVVEQNCPNVRLSDPSKFAYRKCGYNGLWEGRHPNEASSIGWTNFTPCFPSDVQTLFVKVFKDNDIQQYVLSHMPSICVDHCMAHTDDVPQHATYDIRTKYEIAQNSRIIEMIGHSASLVTVVLSIYIFLMFREQLSKRFYLHRCLFLMMLIQTFVYVVLYLDQAINPDDGSSLKRGFKSIASTETLCKSLYVFMEFGVTGTFSWFFLEGYYLNNQVSKNALQKPLELKYYNMFGFGFPVVITAIWTFINWKYYAEKKLKTCWFGYNFAESYWVLQAPRLIIIFINIIILCRVMKTVISKLRANKTSETEKIKKSVKAALMLLPLLGVTNLLSTFDISITANVEVFRFWCYARQFLKSFQGVFLSFVYCFLREEVRLLVTRRYNNMKRMNIFCVDILSKFKLKRRKKKELKQSQLPTITGNEIKDDEHRIQIEDSNPKMRPAKSSDTDSEAEDRAQYITVNIEMHQRPEPNRNFTENLNTTIMEETSFCHLYEGNTEVLI